MGDAESDVAASVAKHLQSEDAGARLSAARGLAALGPEGGAAPHASATADRLADVRTQRQAEAALEQMGIAGARELAIALSDHDDGIRNGAIEALKTMGSPGAQGLARQLAEPDEYRWRTAALALVHMGIVGVEELARCAEDSNPQVQMTAAWALGTAGALSVPHLPVLSQLVLSEDEDVRRIASRALHHLAGHGSSVFVARLLCDHGEEAEDRVTAALSELGLVGARACADRLAETNASVRARAARVLQNLDSNGARALAEKLAADEAHGGARDVRRKAAETLGKMPAELVAPHCQQLAGRLQDEDAWVRTHACRALGAQGAKADRYMGGLAGCLDDSNPNVQKSAAKALGVLAAASPEASSAAQAAASALASRLEDPEYSIRRRAGELLEEMGPVGAEALSGRADKRSAYKN